MGSKQEGLLSRARDLAAAGDFRQAMGYYRELCHMEPYNPDLWLELSGVAESAGFVDDAISTLFHVADLFARAGMAEAAEIAERVLRLDPEHLGAQQFVTMFKARQLASLPPDAELDETADDMSHAVLVSGAEPPGQPGGEPASAVPTEIISPDDLQSDAIRIPLPAADLPSGPVAVVNADRIVISEITVPPSQPISVAPAGELLGAQKRELIESLLATTPSQLIDALEPGAVRAVLDAASLQRCRKGDIIFRQDETGSSLYLILKGSMDVERRGASGQSRKLATLRAGAFFGEMALLADVPRSATVRASSDAILLKLSRKDVRALSERDPRVLALLMRFFRARLVGTLMATSPLFKPLSVDERRALVGKFRMRELPHDTQVLEQGQPSDGLYLVLVGRLGVFIEDEHGHTTELGALGPGDVFGEMSFITGEPAMASIRTLDRSWVLRLPKEDLDAVVRSHPEVLELLSEIAAGRRAKNRETMDA
jgi:CRP-like cAMP-binding protein